MKWYWWILTGIVGINVLALIMIGVFLVLDRLRARRSMPGTGQGESRKGTPGLGR